MGAVEMFMVGTLVFGLGVVMGVMVARDGYQPPAPVDPRGHVRPVTVGTCAECGKSGVRVHLYKHHELLDPEDVCDGCLSALAHEPGLAGGVA